jgi:cysteine desulfurase
MAAAAKAATRDLPALSAQAAWRDGLQARALAAGATVFGANADRLPQTLCFSAEGFDGAVQVMNLDLAGVMVSSGPACSSGKAKPSATIAAMGRPDLAANAIRVSGGWATTEADWVAAGDAWLEAYARHQSRRKVA